MSRQKMPPLVEPEFSQVLDNHGGWQVASSAYRDVINDPSGDSLYLREHGLKPNILDLVRNLRFNRILDVGCGDGWLFDAINPRDGVECDLVEWTCRQRQWPYSIEDVTKLSFSDRSFDLIVGSLVLIWVQDLHRACNELHRVAANNGTLILAIMHPCFYRMGKVTETGDVLIQQNYNTCRVINDLRIADRVGPFRYYHRPLSDYLNTLIDTGWSISELREWSMDVNDYRQQFPYLHPEDRQRTSRLPLYAFIKCTKNPQ